MLPRKKLFVFRTRLQERRLQPQNIVLGLKPEALKLNAIEKQRKDHSCLFRQGDYGIKGKNHEKISPGFESC
jgi:ABC-type thiamine transport system ATPase subunit